MLNLEQQDENQEVKNLKKSLFLVQHHGSTVLSDQTIKTADAFCEEYKRFLDNGKTEREVIEQTILLAQKHGFTEFDHNEKYEPGAKVYYINRNKAAILAVIGKNKTTKGVRVAVAHIDSPRLDLKPNPLYETHDMAFFKTHYYGGIKKYQWLTIPLAIHGTVVKANGEIVSICIGEKENEPRFCITDLLPHLSREQMKKTISDGFSGEDLIVLIGSRPFGTEKGTNLVRLNVLKILNEKYGITEKDFLSAEIEIVPAFNAFDIGFDRSLIGSYGHDDRVCAYPALQALFDCDTPENTIITVLTDKEETGSDGNTGMNSSFFRYFIEDLARGDGFEPRHVLSRSKCLSADVNAAFDPIYASHFEEENSSYINRGVSLSKYTGSGGKANTSDASAEFMAEICAILDKRNVLWQTGELGKVDDGGGGTIAKYIANLNVDVIDLGVPVLSMHAPFEVVSKIDVYMTYLAIKAFFEDLT